MKIPLVVAVVTACVVAGAHGRPQADGYKQPEGYFQYVNVPGHKEYEFGWNRGNPHHYISRFEQAKDHRFRTRVKWSDTYDGYGEHYWEYNHGPKYPELDVYKGPEPAYGPVEPVYGPVEPAYGPLKGYPSENIPVIISNPREIQEGGGSYSSPRE